MSAVGIILAAGRGIRLGDLTADIPKCLLKVGGKSLISWQVEALSNRGIDEIHVVVGYEHEKVMKELLQNMPLIINIAFIYNERWSTANNIYSLYTAREVSTNGFVLINSDDVFHSGILKILLDDPAPDSISVDDYKKLGDEEMKVRVVDRCLAEINKTMPPESADGEYIGIAKFGRDGARELFAVIEEFVHRDDLNVWYEAAFGVLAKRRNIRAVSTGGLPWTEIDTPADLDKARNNIFPLIQSSE